MPNLHKQVCKKYFRWHVWRWVLVCNPYSWYIDEFVSFHTVRQRAKMATFLSLSKSAFLWAKSEEASWRIQLQSSLKNGEYLAIPVNFWTFYTLTRTPVEVWKCSLNATSFCNLDERFYTNLKSFESKVTLPYLWDNFGKENFDVKVFRLQNSWA